MKSSTIKYLVKNYTDYKQEIITGRYITLANIEPIIKKLSDLFTIKKIGFSLKKQSIYKITIGNGKNKILFWSQMHGNESTGTKAIFDLFKFLHNPKKLKKLRDEILENCTLVFIPMLNPDGAKKFTRLNAQKIDLNRDAVALEAVESVLLNRVLYDFKPQYCFNLHDQRTIFSIGEDNKPATLSFLAPSIDKARTVTKGRKETMRIIAGINDDLKYLIPNQIGRYTDEFYPTATGDNFQKSGFNTVLIEAGHYKDDYQREITRKYNFIALISGIHQVYVIKKSTYKAYFKIPENKKNYLDLIYTNIFINDEKKAFGIYLKEQLVKNKIIATPIIKELKNYSYLNANKIVRVKHIFNSITEFESFLLEKKYFFDDFTLS
ncbi:MAG: zinc carboxypeptidase [Flavobacteriaceae bacterium]|nr:zinc carboxypeptidase [Flavobacteriaceae bacterium]